MQHTLERVSWPNINPTKTEVPLPPPDNKKLINDKELLDNFNGKDSHIDNDTNDKNEDTNDNNKKSDKILKNNSNWYIYDPSAHVTPSNWTNSSHDSNQKQYF